VDAGRTRPGRYAPRQADPALAAAGTFAALLGQRGIAVTGPVARTPSPVAAGAPVLAEVRSAPLVEVVQHALAESDNTVAEALARQVGAAAGRPPGFAESAQAVMATLRDLGLDTSGAVLVDGSGLGAGSTVPPALLAGLLAAAAGPDHPQLRPLLATLPVGGLTGTLDDRFLPGSPEDAGAGLVRAKTGSLTGVTSLAGTVVDADGRLLAFAVLADGVGATDPARAAVDAVADALVGCGCR
jgi:D-alanyl-D-alanine carboxypeptidase/D-alanyl-D-alanine-endopeptidase (penicillin-binding protein 4)